MVIKQARSDLGFVRCAVCKIDLKGRFVYLDEKIENLLGYSQEELIGKTLLDFLDSSSQQLIDQLLAQRNHYETFYDTTCLTLLNRNEEPVATRAIVSLNFIAGNPVNFQLILDQTVGLRESGDSEAVLSSRLRTFLDRVLQMDLMSDLNQLLGHLREFVRADAACLYLIDGDNLEPRAAAAREGHGQSVFGGISQANELHRYVAQTGGEYSFIDQEAVRQVIEQHGTAPTELVCCVTLNHSGVYLLRLLFSDDIDPLCARNAVNDARLAIGLVKKMATSAGGSAAPADNAYDIKFTVGFLDSLGIASFLSDRQGYVIGYNPSTLRMFTESQLEGHYTETIRSLVPHNAPGLEKKIIDYVASPGVDESGAFDLNLRVKTSGGETARLTVMKLGDEEGDHSSCFVLVPENGSGPVAGQDFASLEAMVGQFSRYLKSSGEITSKLAHRFYNELGDEGNDLLLSLSGGASAMQAGLGTVAEALEQIMQRSNNQLTDLDLLVRQQFEAQQAVHGGGRASCSHKNLPKVKTRPELMAIVIGSIMSNALIYNDSDKIKIKVEGIISDGTCHLEISDNGFGVAAKHLPKLCDFFYRVPERNVEGRPGLGLGLAVAQMIVRHLGGELSIDSTEGKGTTVSLNFPA